MNDPWLPLTKNIELSRAEKEVVKRYQNNPNGRNFLPFSDILRSHQFIDESLELLIHGVRLHPDYVVARVVLVRELLNNGLALDAWKYLEDAMKSLKLNALAQKLKFHLSILLSYEAIAHATYRHMIQFNLVDDESKRLGDILEHSGFRVVHEKLISEYSDKGIQVVLPERHSFEESAEASNAETLDGPDSGLLENVYYEYDKNQAEGFLVVPLEDIFSDDKSAGQTIQAGVELESLTLAEIYENQGHFEKASSMYRRLLRLSPHNKKLKKRISDLAKKEKAQRHEDLIVDPSIADSMEQLEIINRQIDFYRTMLDKL